MNLEELYDYKSRLMMDICSNEEVVKLLTNNPDAIVPNTQLPYTQVFPFERVPTETDDAKTFICFDVDVISVENRTYYIPIIYLWIFTHESMMRTDNGIRIDRISSALDKHLNGNRFYTLGELELDTVTRFVPTKTYLGRVVTYVGKEFNRPSGSKATPNNRRIGK